MNRAHPLKKRIVVLGVANILVALGLGRFLFPMAAPLIHEHYGISFTRIGIFASLILLGYLSFSYLGGVALHRLSRKTVLLTAFIVLTASFLIPFLSSEYWLLCTGFYLMGSASGTIYMSTFPIINEFVPAHRHGTYLGIIFAGAGLGITLVGAGVQRFMSSSDLTHLVWGVSALICAIVAFINARFLEGAAPGSPIGVTREGVKYYRDAWKALYRDPLLRAMTLAYFFYGASYASYLTYIFSHVAEIEGPARASGLWLMFGLLSIISTLLWGFAYDRIDVHKVVCANYCITAVAILLSISSSSPTALVLSVFFYGLCFFGYITIIGVVIVRATRALSSVYMGKLTLIHTIGQVLGALGGGIARDKTGSFSYVFVFSLATLLISLGLFLTVPKSNVVRSEFA